MARKKEKMNSGYGGRSFRKTLAFTLAICLISYCLAGGINQLATGENIIQFTDKIYRSVSVEISKLIKNEGKVKVTDEGVYFDEKKPDSATDIDKVSPVQTPSTKSIPSPKKGPEPSTPSP